MWVGLVVINNVFGDVCMGRVMLYFSVCGILWGSMCLYLGDWVCVRGYVFFFFVGVSVLIML